MKYMGSKSRIAKDLVPIIQKYINENNINNYCEPFVGGANVIDKIKCNKKVGNDKHEYLIALYNNLDKIKQLPDFITKEHYSEVRDCFNKNENSFLPWYVGAIGFLASYNGRFFDGGYAGIVKTKSRTIRNYYEEAKKNLEKQIVDLENIIWTNKDYIEMKNIKDWVIYCDPPYANTKQYGISKSFNYDKFWNWVREISKNNIVLISEQVAPVDFEIIWETDVKRTIDNNKRVDITEKLFIIKK
jgi:DNA adenine methylase